METKEKKTGMKRLIIIIAVCAIAFALFFTMLVDIILVSLSVSPIFSNIFSTTHERTNYGKVVEGHGILYSTITSKEEFANGYFSSYEFFFGFKKWEEDMKLEISFRETEEEGYEYVLHTDDDFAYGEEYTIFDDGILNMEAVRQLALSDVSPFEFMEKFPGTLIDDEGDYIIYYVVLPNDYVVRIEYSGSAVNYIRLEDHLLDKYLDLREQSLDLDEFLLVRTTQTQDDGEQESAEN